MYSIPRYLQTRADFDRCLSAARVGEARASAVLPHYRGLLETARNYVFDKTLSDGESASGSAPEYIVSEQTDVARAQHKLVEDSSARLFTLGYSVEEVELIIAELEVLNV